MPKMLPKKTREEIIAALNSGITTSEIKQKFKVSTGTVHRLRELARVSGNGSDGRWKLLLQALKDLELENKELKEMYVDSQRRIKRLLNAKNKLAWFGKITIPKKGNKDFGVISPFHRN